jgi:hypothetical protein
MLLGSLLLGCGSDSDPEPTPTDNTTNSAPAVSIAGENTVQEGQVLTLTANASDADGSISSVKWSTTSSDISLTGDDTTSVSFTAPDTDSDVSLTLDVLVTDNDGATATQSVTITITPIESLLTITGSVTDGIDVEVTIGEQAFSSLVDENGTYSIAIMIDESLKSHLALLSVLGDSSINPEVELVSQLGSLASLIEQADSDNILTEDENFGVNITNVTTAEYALLTSDGTAFITDAELTSALSGIDNEQKNTLAALIDIILTDNDFSLPSGVSTTLDLVSDNATASTFEQDVITQSPTLIAETISSIINDNSLTSESDIVGTWKIGSDVLTFTRSGHYVHITTEAEEGGDGKIGYEIGTYSWDQSTGVLNYMTAEDSNGDSGLHDEFEEPLDTQAVLSSTLTATENTLAINDGSDTFNAPRLTSDSNPIVGGFYLDYTNFSNDLSMQITLDDNKTIWLTSWNGELPAGISYLYIMQDYSYDAETRLRIVHSQNVYVDGIIVQQTTEEVGRALTNVQGDVLSSIDENGVRFIKNSYTSTDQDYLNTDDVIGDFDGINGEDSFSVTFNADGTALANGEVVLQWEVTFGQLLLISESFTQIWSPTTLASDIWQFNITEYTAEGDFDRSNVGSLTKSQ